jgi:hypothetical protein
MLIARPYNPYLANHVAMATAWKGDPENIIAKTVREGVKNKIRYNDAQLFTTVTNLVEKGALDPKVAAQQIADYYTASIARNNSSYSYSLLGLPNQDDYKILPKEVKKNVNLIAPVELERFFTWKAIQGKMGFGAHFILPEGVVQPQGMGGATFPEGVQ